MRLPVRTTLLQNSKDAGFAMAAVRLPVRTTLLQNTHNSSEYPKECDYQSERHCSKTTASIHSISSRAITSQNDTAPKRQLCISVDHACAITSQNDTAPKQRRSEHRRDQVRLPVRTTLLQNGRQGVYRCDGCDYQSERHCSKTWEALPRTCRECDYQSERHCSKTSFVRQSPNLCAITSQNDTAPKQRRNFSHGRARAITSQNDTAPKRDGITDKLGVVRLPVRTTLLQNTAW